MKKKYYLTLDTETCTLPFIKEFNLNESDKQKISIAKPIVYDIGWVITDRLGNIQKKVNYLVQETFFVPSIFNTAYYKSKRPIYIDLLKNNQIDVANWNDIMDILETDLKNCDLVTAYNACFDFKKAIPFTERYINALYSDDYSKFEERQKESIINILNNKESHNEKYLQPIFEFRNNEYPIADLWGVACNTLINNNRYKDYCMQNELFTNSVQYFKTSAETTFQYLTKDYDFIESHTALDDSIIESQILTKALKKGKVIPQIQSFPFRELGTTYDYALQHKQYIEVIYNALKNYVENTNAFEKSGAYWSRVCNTYKKFEILMNEV